MQLDANFFCQQALDQHYQVIYWKDCASTYVGGNAAMLKACRLHSESALAGRTDFDLPWQSFAAAYQRDDACVLQGKTLQQYEPIVVNNRIVGSRVYKQPVYQGAAIIGLVGYADVFSLAAIATDDCALPAQHGALWSLFHGVSSRESEVLYYLLRGWSIREIAKKQQVATSTTQEYYQRLKDKFKVHSKAELIAKAFRLGFQFVDPRVSELT